MATTASQIIFHPVVSQSLKFGGTTLGRDKAYRAIQYFSRFLGWYYNSRGEKLEGARWNALKVHLALARKLMRLGKPMEHLQAALKASFGNGSAAEQITTIARQLCYFGYLSYDSFVWANMIKLVNLAPDTSNKVTKYSYRFWLVGILFSIVNDILKFNRLANERRRLKTPSEEKALDQEIGLQTKLTANKLAQEATRTQFIIDLLDLWIPATALELTPLNEGILGILGFLSSVVGGKLQWEAVNSKK